MHMIDAIDPLGMESSSLFIHRGCPMTEWSNALQSDFASLFTVARGAGFDTCRKVSIIKVKSHVNPAVPNRNTPSAEMTSPKLSC